MSPKFKKCRRADQLFLGSADLPGKEAAGAYVTKNLLPGLFGDGFIEVK
jgi:hypothetical protein